MLLPAPRTQTFFTNVIDPSPYKDKSSTRSTIYNKDDLKQFSEEQLLDLLNKKNPKPKKLPSKQELFDIIMEPLESEHGVVPGELIIDALVKTGRFSLVKARKYLSDASRACDIVEAKSGCFRRTSTHI